MARAWRRRTVLVAVLVISLCGDAAGKAKTGKKKPKDAAAPTTTAANIDLSAGYAGTSLHGLSAMYGVKEEKPSAALLQSPVRTSARMNTRHTLKSRGERARESTHTGAHAPSGAYTHARALKRARV